MSTWLAILIVTCGLFLVGAILGLIAVNRDPEGNAARPGAGDPRGEAHDGGVQVRWRLARTTGRPTRSGTRSRPSATQLAGAVDHLRDEIREATDIGAKVKREAARRSPRARSAPGSSSPAGSARRCAWSPGGARVHEGALRPLFRCRPRLTLPRRRPRAAGERSAGSPSSSRAGKQFLADDCMGLSQQVAYSSLLAFFPAMIFLVALPRPDRRLRRAHRIPRPGRAEVGDRHHRPAPAGHAATRLPCSSSSASSARSGRAAGR